MTVPISSQMPEYQDANLMEHPAYSHLRSSGVRRTPITNCPSLREASGRFFGINIHASVPKTGIGSETLENQSQ